MGKDAYVSLTEVKLIYNHVIELFRDIIYNLAL